MVKRPDIIHAIQPPTTCLAAWVLSRWWGVPFVYEIHDMWPESLSATGMVKEGWALRRIGDFCRWVHETADAIRVLSSGFRDNLIAKGVRREKIYSIPNWMDTGKHRPTNPDPILLEQLSARGKFNIVYAGNIGLAQGLDSVVESAAILAAEPRINFLMFGGGVELERLRGEVDRRGLSNIQFQGPYPPDQMNHVCSIADALLISLRSDPLFEITIPLKTLAYLAAGKPIIAAVGGDAADVVASAGAGITCKAGAPQELAETVRRLSQTSPEALAEMGRRGRQWACDHFSRPFLVRQVASMLEEVVARRKEQR